MKQNSLNIIEDIELTNQPTDVFVALYDKHQKHLLLQGLRVQTREAYSRAIRRLGTVFSYEIEDLKEDQLVDYFYDLLRNHAQSTVKQEYCGIRFFYLYVLKRDWVSVPLVKATAHRRIPNILTSEQAEQLFANTETLSYRVFFYTIYSMGLRLREGLKLEVGDIDAQLKRVHIRDSKGGKDRFVPLPDATLRVLRRFWKVHRNPVYLFPNRVRKLNGARFVKTPLDRYSAQRAMQRAVRRCRFTKKITIHSLRHSYATHLIEEGVGLLELQHILGHACLSTTVKYTHLTKKTQSRAQVRINRLMDGVTLSW